MTESQVYAFDLVHTVVGAVAQLEISVLCLENNLQIHQLVGCLFMFQVKDFLQVYLLTHPQFCIAF